MIKDIKGQKWNKLTAIAFIKVDNGAVWLFKCECGNEKELRARSVKTGRTTSCGCKSLSGRFQKGRKSNNRTHGMHGTRFYRIYRGIKNRCENSNEPAFKDYGGRGIDCLWSSFEQFKRDMYESYISHIDRYGLVNTTIDRRDNNLGYSMKNCRWATLKEQMRNKRSNVLYTFQGEGLTLSQISEKIDIPWKTLWRRINYSKWTPEKAFSTPLRQWPGPIKL